MLVELNRKGKECNNVLIFFELEQNMRQIYT